MVVVPVSVLKKVETDKIDSVFDFDDDNQAIARQDEDLVVKMVVENNELQRVATLYVLDIIDEKVEKVDLSEVVLENL